MEDTKVLLDENTHNVRHLSSFYSQQFSHGSHKLTRSKLRLIMSKVLNGAITPVQPSLAAQNDDRPNKLIKSLIYILLSVLVVVFVVFIIHSLTRASVDKPDKVPHGLNQDNGFNTTSLPMLYKENIRWIVSSKKCHIPNIGEENIS